MRYFDKNNNTFFMHDFNTNKVKKIDRHVKF